MLDEYHITPVTFRDVDEVFSNPWEATQKDMDVFGFSDMSEEERRYTIVDLYAKEYGLAIRDNSGKMIAITGACRENDIPETWWTWFFATPNFLSHAKDVTGIIANMVNEYAEKEGAREVRAYSPADSKEAILWFRRLGFQKSESININDAKLNIFKRSFK